MNEFTCRFACEIAVHNASVSVCLYILQVCVIGSLYDERGGWGLYLSNKRESKHFPKLGLLVGALHPRTMRTPFLVRAVVVSFTAVTAR